MLIMKIPKGQISSSSTAEFSELIVDYVRANEITQHNT